jgi:hypothetical protein
MPTSRQIGLPLILGGVVVFLVSSLNPDTEQTSTTPSPSATSESIQTDAETLDTGQKIVLDLLAELTLAEEIRDGYQRELFMSSWIDEDGDGCDTRREVLIYESLIPVEIGENCKIISGKWISIFDGFETTDPQDLDIDHFVPLAEAWDSGASNWAADKRSAFANDLNDPDTLIAVSKQSNRSKGDRDPTDWLPPLEQTHCWYATTWVSIKHKWELSVDENEFEILKEILTNC